MGCGSSTPAEPTPSVAGTTISAPNKEVEAAIEAAKIEDEGKIKMLLLGAGESGKSTIFKQMRILYGKPREDNDLKMFGCIARGNIVVIIRKLVAHLRDLGLEEELDKESKEKGGDISLRQSYDDLIAHLVDLTANAALDESVLYEGDWCGSQASAGAGLTADALLFMYFHKEIKMVWESEVMKTVWKKRSSINCIDAHKDYLNDIDRIAAKDFKPNQQDILISRVRTTQVIQEKYRIDNVEFEIIDVGGQRSERRKWIDCFDSVTAVIFVVALSEYDQTLAEAKRTNRMIEALELFRSVCNNRAFENTSILLFLNKKDVFADKIMYSDIAAQRPFSDYTGPTQSFDDGVLYFMQKFKECLIDDDFNDSFIHTTCATDTNNMQFVLDSTRTILMAGNLQVSGFLGSD